MFKIDLTKIAGDGDFQCPVCREIISPEDESDTIYDIIDVELDENNMPQQVTLLCKKCGNFIQLEGFEQLSSMNNIDELFKLNDYLSV